MEKRAYNQDYYAWRKNPALHSAEIVVPHIIERFKPLSVVDLGCAEGAWLSVFSNHGVKDLLGFDGPWGSRSDLRIPEDKFKVIDFENFTSPCDRTFDLAISLEVAEHVSEHGADDFVHELTRLSKRIIFSAAIPGQGGLHHVNEQPPSYWREKFEKLNYHQVDDLRAVFWETPKVAWWYSQNMFLYECESIHKESQAHSFDGRHLVHPRAFHEKQIELDAGNMSARNLFKTLVRRILRVSKKRMENK
jgi:hypothetical protein